MNPTGTGEPVKSRSSTDPRPGRPLRVALVTGSYDYITDGVTLTLNRLVDYLEKHGVEVLVFAPTGAPAFAHSGTLVSVPSVPIPTRAEYRFALGLRGSARRRLRDFQPDIIHIAVPDLLGYRALKLAQAWKVPVVASYHTRYETYLEHYRLGWLKTVALRYLNGFYSACREVYVPASCMADVLKEQGVSGIRPWPWGVDPVRFQPSKRSTSWRAKHGIDRPAVVFVGRLVREKCLATLVDVLAALKSRGQPHRAVLVGKGPEEARLRSELPDAVFTGFLDGDELATAYASSDVFLFPSDTESFGLVTLEAMASGLPCVCADATGSRSLVEPGVTGFLSAPGDVPGLTDQVAALVTDAAMRERMGRAGRARSLAFSWDESMAMILGYYASLLGSARPG
jgi:glycosyltransferase involved in cell wall biosynthesis